MSDILELLQIGDLVTVRSGKRVVIHALEFVYQGSETFANPGWYIPIVIPEIDCYLLWGVNDFRRVERDGEVIWQSDQPMLDIRFTGLPMFAGLEATA